MKKLIAFYTRAGENYVDGAMKELEKGNTEVIAETLQKLTGADLFQIEQKTPYSGRYRECVGQAKEDFANHARPEILNLPESLDEYDTIYLGFPNYCGTMPMAVFTFLEAFDLTDKKIYPFCSNEGSGMARSVDDIRTCCPGAEVTEGLSVHGCRMDMEAMKEWIW